MDKLSAHLDRGWDLLTKGDARGARTSARKALDIDGDSPEAHTLLGNAAAQEGDTDEALEHFRQAMALDEGFIDPMLGAAELLVHPMHDFDGAIALCDEVLELAETPEETVDAMLIKFEALLSQDNNTAARRLLDGLPEGPLEGASYPFLLGRAWFDLGDPDKAEGYFLEALKAEPDDADAHYFLGLVRDKKGDNRGAAISLLDAHHIDIEAPLPPFSLSREAFHKRVEHALAGLEPDVLAVLVNALVLVADAPGIEVVVDGIDPRASVLIDGLRDEARTGPGSFVRVYVYQRAIERACASADEIDEEIARQVTDEVRWLLSDQPNHPHDHHSHHAHGHDPSTDHGVLEAHDHPPHTRHTPGTPDGQGTAPTARIAVPKTPASAPTKPVARKSPGTPTPTPVRTPPTAPAPKKKPGKKH